MSKNIVYAKVQVEVPIPVESKSRDAAIEEAREALQRSGLALLMIWMKKIKFQSCISSDTWRFKKNG